MTAVDKFEGNFTICINQSQCPFFQEFHVCLTCEQMCFVVEASEGCQGDSLYLYSFFSGWAREVYQNEECEKANHPDFPNYPLTYKCDPELFTEVAIMSQLREEPIAAGEPRLLYQMVLKEEEEQFHDKMIKDFGLGFMLSNVVGPGFVPAVQIWYATGTTS